MLFMYFLSSICFKASLAIFNNKVSPKTARKKVNQSNVIKFEFKYISSMILY